MDRSSLYYEIYPSVTIPQLSLLFGLSTWGLLAPVVVMMVAEARSAAKASEMMRLGDGNNDSI
jgi:hypothetical protein